MPLTSLQSLFCRSILFISGLLLMHVFYTSADPDFRTITSASADAPDVIVFEFKWKKYILVSIPIKYFFNEFVTFLDKRINLHKNNHNAWLNCSGISSKLYLKNNNRASFLASHLFLEGLVMIPTYCIGHNTTRYTQFSLTQYQH